MTTLEEPSTTNYFGGGYRSEGDIWLGNRFQAHNIYFNIGTGPLFSMANPTVIAYFNMLEQLGIADRSAGIEARLTLLQLKLTNQQHLQSTSVRLQKPVRGFGGWKLDLTEFDGDKLQARSAREPALSVLTEIERLISSMETRLAKPPVTSEDLISDVTDLDLKIQELISFFPRSSGRNARVQEVADIPQNPRQGRSWRMPSLAPTDESAHTESAPPDPQRRRETNPLPLRADSDGGNVFDGFNIGDKAEVQVGHFHDISAGSAGTTFPSRGMTVGRSYIGGHARVQFGDIYGTRTTTHPLFNSQFDVSNTDMPRSNSMPV